MRVTQVEEMTMARGPAPKDPAQRVRRNAEVRTAVTAGRCPPMPLPEGHRPETVRWFAVWCSAPQAVLFNVTEWQRLHQLAYIVDAFYASGGALSYMAEIRIGEGLLGATPGDRARLKWDLKPPATDDATSAPRRERLKVV